jgi:transcriptional regulator with XRE-family HTH domain
LQEEVEVIPAIYLIPRLEALRAAAGLSIADLAQRTEVAADTIADLESGRCITRATADRLAHAVSAATGDNSARASEMVTLADPSGRPKAAREKVVVVRMGAPALDARG